MLIRRLNKDYYYITSYKMFFFLVFTADIYLTKEVLKTTEAPYEFWGVVFLLIGFVGVFAVLSRLLYYVFKVRIIYGGALVCGFYSKFGNLFEHYSINNNNEKRLRLFYREFDKKAVYNNRIFSYIGSTQTSPTFNDYDVLSFLENILPQIHKISTRDATQLDHIRRLMFRDSNQSRSRKVINTAFEIINKHENQLVLGLI